MDRSCSEDAEYNDFKSGSLLDARWKEKVIRDEDHQVYTNLAKPKQNIISLTEESR